MTLAPFQSHSHTSMMGAQEAALKSDTQIQTILIYIETRGLQGATGKEVAKRFNMQTGTVSARLRDMQLRGMIKKSATIRDKSSVWLPARYVQDECERKRDRVGEALALIEAMKKEEHGRETIACLDRVYAVLK